MDNYKKLHEKTVEMLNETRLSPFKIAKEINLSHRWVYNVKDRETDNHGFASLNKLHNFLLKDKAKRARKL